MSPSSSPTPDIPVSGLAAPDADNTPEGLSVQSGVLPHRKVFFPNLDGLRFVAFCLVFLQHGISPSYEYLPIKKTFIERFLHTVSNGGTGVSIFFVLSGFLITYLVLSETELKGRLDVKSFYMRRALRIWPLYFAVVFWSVTLYPYLKDAIGITDPSTANSWMYWAFLANFDVLRLHLIGAAGDASSRAIVWSVSVEEQFYILWPLLFVLVPRRKYLWLFVGVIVISMGFRIINRNDPNVLYFHTLAVILDMAVGGLLAFLIFTKPTFQKTIEALPKIAIVGCYVLGIGGLLWQPELSANGWGAAWSRLAFALFFGFIILEQNFARNSLWKLSRSRVLTFWGKYTYGLYLLHPIAILFVDLARRLAKLPNTSFITLFSYGVIALLISLIMAWVSYEWYESRFIALKKKFSYVTRD